uniref:Uncharacterized protein n=1 Tax=Picea glauca TaxID=3330 RepID=A0A117NFK6_PICGL|nr:hypothetical protein ABT39_MTgene2664 [Picea glauca]QHR88646.1 hypothetical protein Q903MT_gene2660 [Picea sitchensis]QHR92512.1 hypothetical protein Q903MT_gene6558 [Picea sitchensis]
MLPLTQMLQPPMSMSITLLRVLLDLHMNLSIGYGFLFE